MEQLENISSAKDILIGYIVSKLNNQQCGELYYSLIGKDNIEPVEGVSLTPQQYTKLLYYWGEEKFKEVVNKYKSLVDSGKFATSPSVYMDMFRVARTYYNEEYWSGVNMMDIDISNVDSGREYIKSVPYAARCGDEDVKMMVQKFGADVLEEKEKKKSGKCK